MALNYPDNVTHTSPDAPWNAGDPDPLVCSECFHNSECDEVAGDLCTQTFNRITDEPCHPDREDAEHCTGKYESTRCDTCNSISCRCDDD